MIDAVDYIARLRQAEDLSTLPVGRRVVVIGGGMTAIDAAVQSKKLGAENVTMVYRRGPEQMKASAYERELAQTNGVVIRYWARPVALEGRGGTLSGVVFESGNGEAATPAARLGLPPRRRHAVSSPSDSAARRKRSAERRSRSRTAASSSTTSAARRLRASGPAAIASTAGRT